MDEYISRKDVLRKFIEGDGHDDDRFTEGYNFAVQEYREEVKKIPAADVQPVKRGRWETWGYVFHGIEWKRCSVCGKTADISYIALLEGRIEPVTPSFCGCCGARMIKDGETE